MASAIPGRVVGRNGLNRPFTRSVVVRVGGVESRAHAEKLVGKVVSLWDHLGLPIRGKVTGVRDDDGAVVVTMSRRLGNDHPVSRAEIVV